MCRVRIADINGVTCPTDTCQVKMVAEGPATFLGADNGDMADHTLYNIPERESRDGRCLFIVRKTGDPGRIRLHFSADGLKGKRFHSERRMG